MERVHASQTLKDMFRWENDEGQEVPPSHILEQFRASALKVSKRSIWATFSNQTKRAGLAIAKHGAGTWHAPNDAMLGQALRVAPVAGLTRPFHSAPSKSR